MESHKYQSPEITVFLQNIEGPFDLDLFSRGLSLLPYSLQKEVVAYKHQMDAWRALVGKLLWASFLGKDVLPKESLDGMRRDEFKRPFIYGGNDGNIAHSENWIAFASTERGSIGVDIQAWKKVSMPSYRGSFTENERGYIEDAEDTNAAFFRIWARKEALVKADGRGMHIQLSEFDVLDDEVYFDGEWYFMVDIEMPKGISAAFATTEKPKEIKIMRYPRMNMIGRIGYWIRKMS